VEFIPKNCKQPGPHVGTCSKAGLICPSLHDRVLNKIVCLVMTTGQRYSKSPQVGQGCEKIALETTIIILRHRHFTFIGFVLRSASSSFSRRSRKRSGMPSS